MLLYTRDRDGALKFVLPVTRKKVLRARFIHLTIQDLLKLHINRSERARGYEHFFVPASLLEGGSAWKHVAR